MLTLLTTKFFILDFFLNIFCYAFYLMYPCLQMSGIISLDPYFSLCSIIFDGHQYSSADNFNASLTFFSTLHKLLLLEIWELQLRKAPTSLVYRSLWGIF